MTPTTNGPKPKSWLTCKGSTGSATTITMKPAGTENITGVKSDADAAAAAAHNVKRASEMLESESQHLGDQVNDFLSRIRAA